MNIKKVIIEFEDGTRKEFVLRDTQQRTYRKTRNIEHFKRAIVGVLYGIVREKGKDYTPTIIEIKKALDVKEEEVTSFERALEELEEEGMVDVFPIRDVRYVRLIGIKRKQGRDYNYKKSKKDIRRFKEIVK